MDVPALIDHALEAVDHNQAELARKVGRSQTTVSRWRTGQTGIDYESALRLVPVTGLPVHTILTTAGLDPSLMGVATAPAPMPPTPNTLQRQVGRHCLKMDDVNEKIEQMPEHYWKEVVERILARAEFDIRDTVNQAFRLYTVESEAPSRGKLKAARSRRPKHLVARRLTKRSVGGNASSCVLSRSLSVRKVAPPCNHGESSLNPDAASPNIYVSSDYSTVVLIDVGCDRQN